MAKDLCLNQDLDLDIRNGDFVIAESAVQDMFLIVKFPPGSFKQYPLLGVGESILINGPLDARLRKEIQLQLESDGIRPKSISIEGQNIDIKI